MQSGTQVPKHDRPGTNESDPSFRQTNPTPCATRCETNWSVSARSGVRRDELRAIQHECDSKDQMSDVHVRRPEIEAPRSSRCGHRAPCGGEQRQHSGAGHGDPQTVRHVDVPRGCPITPETDSHRRHRAFLPDVESPTPSVGNPGRMPCRVPTRMDLPVPAPRLPRNRLLPGDLLLQEGIRSKSPEPRAVFDRAVEAK